MKDFKQSTIITPAKLKVMEKHGLLVMDRIKYSENIVKTVLNPESLREVCNTIFDMEENDKIDFDAIDLAGFQSAVQGFLQLMMGA